MTREVAIRNLEMIRIAFVNPVTKEQRKLIDDTVDMAISALSENKADMRSESCNTCKNSDDEFSGECYECVKNIQNHYKAESEE